MGSGTTAWAPASKVLVKPDAAAERRSIGEDTGFPARDAARRATLFAPLVANRKTRGVTWPRTYIGPADSETFHRAAGVIAE